MDAGEVFGGPERRPHSLSQALAAFPPHEADTAEDRFELQINSARAARKDVTLPLTLPPASRRRLNSAGLVRQSTPDGLKSDGCKARENSPASQGTRPATSESACSYTSTITARSFWSHGSLPAELSLPPEVWGRVPLWLRPREFLRLCRCNSWLLFPRERQKIWRFFCHLEGYARLADDVADRVTGTVPAGQGVVAKRLSSRGPGPEVIDWQRTFQSNAVAENPSSEIQGFFVCVRVGDEEIRVPALADTEFMTGQNRHRVEDEDFWLFTDMAAATEQLQRGMERLLLLCETPFRFRSLAMGRPGALVGHVKFNSVGGPANVMLEWPVARSVNGTYRWGLPPHQQFVGEDAPHNLRLSPLSAMHASPVGESGRGWLVELVPDAAMIAANRGLNGISKWVHLGMHKPSQYVGMGEFCCELASHLYSFGIPSATPVYPADLRKQAEPSDQVRPLWLLRRDFRWTQGERLYLSSVLIDKRRTLPWETGIYKTPQHPNILESNDDRDAQRVVLITRDTKRSRRQMLRRGAQDPTTWDSAMELARAPGFPVHEKRFLPEPEPQTKEPELGLTNPDSWGRQVSVESTDGMMKDEPLNVTMAHSRRLLLSSTGVRQFEFHPTRSSVMLAGRKDGVITILNYDTDTQTHALEVDSYPILGLSWLQTQPHRAVVGASQSGSISVIGYDDKAPGRIPCKRLEPFPHLSSLSVNCTDDYFMTSGFCIDLALYDLCTGRRLNTFLGLHQNFINILRFAHRSPHLFATASFDHTCKVWDLREPINGDRPKMLFRTDTLNVMCCFSPDDKRVLCSGVDTALQEFHLEKPDTYAGTRFSLPPMNSDTNYRRSLYLADGGMIATAATNESLLRFYTTSAPHTHRGYIDFRNMLSSRRSGVRPGGAMYERVLAAGAAMSQTVSAMSQTVSADSADSLQSSRVVEPWTPSATAGSNVRPADAQNDAEGPGDEYVQSLRCHPTDPSLLGCLLSSCDDPHTESYIAMIHLDEGQNEPDSPRR